MGIKRMPWQRWAVLTALCGMTLCGCQNTYVFEKKIAIGSMPEKVFKVVSDFPSYPSLFPEFEKQVNVISKTKSGKGEIFENVTEFNGIINHSRWEVTEYEKNKLIRLESPSVGTIIILLNQIDYNTTEETMVVVTRIPDNYKNDIFALYAREMVAVKRKCEGQG